MSPLPGARRAAVLLLPALVAGLVVLAVPGTAQEGASRSVVLGTATAPPDLDAWPTSPPVSAVAHLLLDVDADVVLAADDADERRAVASTVKMLTAITVRRLLPDPASVVLLGDEVAGVEGASTGLVPGDELTVRALLEALLVRSGNDAAVGLAVAASGSVPAFAAEMRADAAAIGVDAAVLVTPSGLEDLNRLTARDLADIAVVLLDDPVLAEIVDLPEITLPRIGVVPTRNELVLTDPSVTGVKTGFTDAAGNSLVVAAEREGRRLVAVVLGSPDPVARFDDAARLLDHAQGFRPQAPTGTHVVGCAGPDGLLPPPPVLLMAPIGATLGSSPLGVDCAGRVAAVQVELDEEAWVDLPSVLERPAGPVLDDDAALGRALVDAVQAALRAVPPGG